MSRNAWHFVPQCRMVSCNLNAVHEILWSVQIYIASSCWSSSSLMVIEWVFYQTLWSLAKIGDGSQFNSLGPCHMPSEHGTLLSMDCLGVLSQAIGEHINIVICQGALSSGFQGPQQWHIKGNRLSLHPIWGRISKIFCSLQLMRLLLLINVLLIIQTGLS